MAGATKGVGIPAARRTFSLRGVIALVVLAAALAAAVGPAGAGHVGCGAVLTSDTTLDSDLSGCPGDGLVIGAAGITVDLNGHIVSGSGTAGTAGIRNQGFHGVVVRDGRITLFDHGVSLSSAKRNLLTGLKVTENTEAGIVLTRSHRNRVVANEVDNNRDDTIGIGRGDGILLRLSHGNRILDNEASASGSTPPSAGIALYGSRGNRVSGNNGNNSFYAILLADHSDKNAIFGNGAGEFGSDGNDVGIAVLNSDRTLIRRNDASSNAIDGIYVALGSERTAIERNVARGNSLDDGIDVDDPSTFVARNVANDNGDLGIEAVPGVRDGGGNTASGNGNPLQCLFVSCS